MALLGKNMDKSVLFRYKYPMDVSVPFYKRIPYRHLILDIRIPPVPQTNGERWRISGRRMNDYDIFICEAGRASFEIEGREHLIEPGMALLIPPNREVNARKISREPVAMIAQHFMLYLFQQTDFFGNMRYRNPVRLPNRKLLFALTGEIRRIMERVGEAWSPHDTSALIMLLLREFIEESFIEQDFREEHKSHLVLRMIAEIDESYTEARLLERLAAESPYGYSHTAKIFKAYTGLSLKSYIIERRIQAGKEALIRGKNLVASAEAAGYEDNFYFSRIFKKYTGLSPRDFRKQV